LRAAVVHPEFAVHLHDVRRKNVLIVKTAFFAERQSRLVPIAIPIMRPEPTLEWIGGKSESRRQRED
jgi:hypothetical protein